jgi:hypothetical protein
MERLERVKNQRKEIDALLNGLDSVVTDLESSVGSLQCHEADAVS